MLGLWEPVRLEVSPPPIPAKVAMSHPSPARKNGRRVLLGAALAAALLGLAVQTVRSPRGLAALPLFDFVEYWAAGRLNAAGENPYDPERIHEVEHEAEEHPNTVLMWNPPWTLTLVMPFGLL